MHPDGRCVRYRGLLCRLLPLQDISVPTVSVAVLLEDLLLQRGDQHLLGIVGHSHGGKKSIQIDAGTVTITFKAVSGAPEKEACLGRHQVGVDGELSTQTLCVREGSQGGTVSGRLEFWKKSGAGQPIFGFTVSPIRGSAASFSIRNGAKQ